MRWVSCISSLAIRVGRHQVALFTVVATIRHSTRMDSLNGSNFTFTLFRYIDNQFFVRKQLQDVQSSQSSVESLPHPISRGLPASLTIFRFASSVSAPANGPQPLSR
jgi:hypothetical protein